MATLKTVTGLIKDAGGNPLAGVEVRAVLSQGVTIPGVQETPPTAVKTKTAPDGTWSMGLYANLDFTPPTTSYLFHEGSDAPRVAIVPQSAGPFPLSSILAAAPAPSPPAALDSAVVHIGSPTGQEVITGKKVYKSGTPWNDLGAWAVMDGQFALDVGCVNGQAAITSAHVFTQADVGKLFDLYGGGIVGTQLGTIAAVDANGHATLSLNANHNAANAILLWFTDDTANAQAWATAGGRLRVAGGATGLCVVTGPVTLPGPTVKMEGGAGSIWISARAAGQPWFLNIDACLAHSRVSDVVINCSLGYLGRFLNGSTANEPGSDLVLRDLSFFTPNDGGDYLVFLKKNVASLERIYLNTNNHLYNKSLCHMAVISSSESVDCGLFGRTYINAQSYAIRNCGTGPIRAANNSVEDGSGSALQTNTLTIDGSSYVYSSGFGGTDYPCVESVTADANGADVAGGAFPNLLLDGSFFVTFAGLQATQYAISGNFTCIAGGTGIIAEAAGFVSSSTSVATSVVLVRATGGPGAVYLRNCGASFLAGVATAKLLLVTSGTTEMLTDFMPSGVTTQWQHPALSTIVGTPTAWPASGTVVRHVYPTPYWITFTPTSAITKIEVSSDNVTFVTLWTGGGTVVVPYNVLWRGGVYLKVTYAGAAPTYLLQPVP